MKIKTQEDYLKEIAEKFNNAKKYEIDNPTLEDILNLKEYESIITEGEYFPVIIRKKYTLDTVLNIPVIFWSDGYEIGDTVMGMIPYEFTAEEILEEIKGFKDEDVDI